MAGLSLEKISEEYFDVLKELGNIGAGNATSALAAMLQCKVDMKVPQVKLLGFDELGELMGGEEQIVVGIYLVVEGDINGSIIFMMEKQSVNAVIKKLMGAECDVDALSEMEESAITLMDILVKSKQK